jgi:hypothetical protein
MGLERHPERASLMEEIIEGFKTSAGNFDAWYHELSQRERVLFKKWLQSMRDNPSI